MPIIDTRFRLRRDTAANWASVNPVPLDGEPCIETDTGLRKRGDGSTNYNSLLYIISGDFEGLGNIADGQVPVWDAANGRWKAGEGGAEYIPGYGIEIDSDNVISSTVGSIPLSGRVSTYGDLPATLMPSDDGKAYLVDSDGLVYVWDGFSFPADGNGLQLRYDFLSGRQEITGSAATSMTVTGLDLSSVNAYEVRFSVKGAVSSADLIMSMYFNGDTTESHYTRQYLVSNGGATISSQSSNAYIVDTTMNFGSMTGEVVVMSNLDNYKFSNVSAIADASAGGINVFRGGHRWKDTANVTSITLSVNSSNGMAVGSYMEVIKR